MTNSERLKRSQSGQILMFTTIILMVAALILVPLMQFVFTSHRSAQIRQERTEELYASDAGIEDAMYQIKTERNGTALANLGFGGDSFDPGTPGVNDRDVNVNIQKVWLPEDLPGGNKTAAPIPGSTDKSDELIVVGMLKTIQKEAATDDFSSGWPKSGTGNWTGNWTYTGSTSIVSSGGCNGNTLKLADVSSTATRTANLLKYMNPQLKFTAKAVSLEGDDTIDLNVTYGNSTGNYTETVASWTTGNVTCDPYDFNLYDLYGWKTGNNTPPSTLKISFDADFSAEVTAMDDFSSGGFSGGLNWSSTPWTTSGSGSASVINSGANAHSPNYDVKLSGNGYAMRRVRLAPGTTPEINVWAKQNIFGSSDYAYLKVSTMTSPNPTTPSHWSSPNGETKKTWNSSDSSFYTGYTYDLSTYAGQNIWILFSGSMSTGAPVASDLFESGWPSGGSGSWVGSWTTSVTGTGNIGLASDSGYFYSPSNALRFRTGSNAGSATATRRVDISGQSNPQIRFYAISRSIDSNDSLTLRLSANGSSWSNSITPGVGGSYQAFSYNVFDYVPVGTTQLWIRFNANMDYSSSGTYDYFYIDDITIGDPPCFYFDDVSVTHAIGTDSDSFYVDNLWIGDEYNYNTIEMAYTDADFDGGPADPDPAYLDRIGVWMPLGCHYVGVVGNETSVELRDKEPNILPNTYAGGTILEWDYGNVSLHDPPLVMPKVKTLTFVYKVDVTQTVEGMFTWIAADSDNTNPPGQGGDTQDDYISWDKGYEIYKAFSQAHSEIYGTNTKVTAYVAQGELNKKGVVVYGDYVAAGNSLLRDMNSDARRIRETPYASSTATISSILSNAEVKAAWLYWSAFIRSGQGSGADTMVDFMFPKQYTESFNVTQSPYETNAHRDRGEPIVSLPELPVLTLSPIRYCGENLGVSVHGNETFFTAHKPIVTPAVVNVTVGSDQCYEGTDYVINYLTGNVTLTNPALSGEVLIDYSVSGSMTLVSGTHYSINYSGGVITIIEPCLAGTVTAVYWASHWETVSHYAADRYGAYLQPIVEQNESYGYSYACFKDVTGFLGSTGNGQYGMRNVDATPGVDGTNWGEWAYSGWSLIIVYSSPSEKAHRLYLYDPIHNNGTCPFYSGMNKDIPFTISDFYPPEGMAEGRLTYFVGEGDQIYTGDYIRFKGASDTVYIDLFDPPINPVNNVLNGTPTVGVAGVDIDTFHILPQDIGEDTSANVKFTTGDDSWNLVCIVLSFKTNEKPKEDFAFDVASVTYQYELGQ